MSEEQNSVNETDVDSTEKTLSEMPETDNRTENAKYIAESKKYRQRAQDAEAKLKEYQDSERLRKQKKLEEEGRHKEIIAEQSSKIEKLQQSDEELQSLKASIREDILSTMTDEDKEEFGDLPTAQLKKVAQRLTIKEKSVPVDSTKPSARQFEDPSINSFKKGVKEMGSHQRQKKWSDFIKSQKN
jgi:hypothetical protein